MPGGTSTFVSSIFSTATATKATAIRMKNSGNAPRHPMPAKIVSDGDGRHQPGRSGAADAP